MAPPALTSVHAGSSGYHYFFTLRTVGMYFHFNPEYAIKLPFCSYAAAPLRASSVRSRPYRNFEKRHGLPCFNPANETVRFQLPLLAFHISFRFGAYSKVACSNI